MSPGVVRLARADDGAAVAAIYAPYVRDTAITFEVDAPDAEEMSRRIESTLATHPYLVWEEEAGVAGFAYATRHRERAAYRWSVDVSVYVAGGQHRRGIGRALYDALVPLVARQGFVNAYAGITLPNRASVGLHEALGFRPIGIYEHVGFKLGSWHPVGWWGLMLQAALRQPAEPTPLPLLPADVLAALGRR